MSDTKIPEFQGQNGILVTDRDGDGKVTPGKDGFEKLVEDKGVKGVFEPETDAKAPATPEEVQEALDHFKKAKEQLDELSTEVDPMLEALAKPELKRPKPRLSHLKRLVEEIERVAGTLDDPSDLSPHLRGRFRMKLAGTEAGIAKLVFFLFKGRHGMRAYRAMQVAAVDYPSNSTPWYGRGMAMLTVCTNPWIRMLAEGTFADIGVDLDVETAEIMSNLARFTRELGPQIMLDNMLDAFAEHDTITIPANLVEQREAIRSRAEDLRLKDVAGAEEIDEHFQFVRKLVAKQKGKK